MKTKTSHVSRSRFPGILPAALLVAGAFVLAGSQAPAQTTAASPAIPASASGAIEGTVYNTANDLPVSKARVVIAGTTRETLTGEDGSFYFENVPAGELTLNVSYLGFLPQTATITVSAGKTTTRDFQIRREGPSPRAPGGEEVVMMERFTIVADRELGAQAIAMNEQRHAASISHILALDELPGQGFENIGDYIRFLPGVSIIDDGESASQLSLGGFPSSMSIIQIDGGAVASTGLGEQGRGGDRELTLQDVPMMNIERVEITKVPTPDRPASGLGGAMNLVSKGLLGTRRARLDYTLTMNLATNDNFSFSGESPQSGLPSLSTASKQPSYSVSAVVPAIRNRLVFSTGYSKSWKQLPRGMLTETADWNLWKDTRFNNSTIIWGGADLWPVRYEGDTEPYDPEAPPGTYPGVTKGDYPIALNAGGWSYMARLTSTEEIQAGMEIRLSRRNTLAFSIRHREVSEETSINRVGAMYGSNNGTNPAYNAGVPPLLAGTYVIGRGNPATTTGNATAIGDASTGQNYSLNSSYKTTTDLLSLGYKHRGSKWSVNGNAFYSKGTRLRISDDCGYIGGYITTTTADGVGRFYMVGTGINTTDSILPTQTSAARSDGTPADPLDTDNHILTVVNMGEFNRVVTTNYEGRLDVERVFSRFFSLKTGGAWTRAERDIQRETPTWRMLTRAQGHPMASVVASDPRLVSHYDIIDESIDVKIGGVPVRSVSPVKLWRLTQEHPEYFQHYSSVPTEEYAQRSSYSKLLREDISAAYLRADIRLFNNRLHAIVGARYERTDVDGWSGRVDNNAKWIRDEDGNRIRDEIAGGYLAYPDGDELWRRMYQVRSLHLARSYDGLYPSVNINYALTPNLVARAAYARTIGRPNVGDIVAGVTLPEITDDDRVYRIRIGNPGLEPWTADSFHLSFDSYHFKGGFGSIGVYRKSVTNFFYPVVYRGDVEEALLEVGISQSDIDAMMNTGGVEITHVENIGNAELTGIEFTYRQDLFFLPSWMQKTQVWFNYTHIKVDGPNAEDFIGFTPDAFSAGINYIRPRFSLRVSVAYQGETKTRKPARTTGSSRTAHLMPPGTYDYQAARTRWSMTAEYSLSHALILFANCSDVFADDILTYRRAPDTPTYARNYQRRVVASYLSIGVKGRF